MQERVSNVYFGPMSLLTVYILVFLGGLIGFGIHYSRMHYATGISVFSIGGHAMEGTLFTLVGILIGVSIHYMLTKKPK